MPGIRRAKAQLELNFRKGVRNTKGFHRHVSQKRKTPLHTTLTNKITDMETLRCSRTVLPQFSLIILFLLLSSPCMPREVLEGCIHVYHKRSGSRPSKKLKIWDRMRCILES